MRAFIAIELPEEIKTILSRIHDQLKQTHADVKFVQPQNTHITLKFLGEIDQNLVKEICSTLNDTAQKSSPFILSLSNLGAFPKLKYPRVIWMGVTNDRPVIKIAEELEKRMIKIGFPKESRPFSSHITLGRVRSSLNRKALIEKLDFLNKSSSSVKPEFKVHSLTLFKSTLTPTGPIYEAIFNCPLRITVS